MPYKDAVARRQCNKEAKKRARARGKVVAQQPPITSELCKLKWLKKMATLNGVYLQRVQYPRWKYNINSVHRQLSTISPPALEKNSEWIVPTELQHR
jgi:hypothetical protein